MMLTQNSFSRTVANEGKMGAYYTDLSHCRDIGNLFLFPENEEVSVLEPSIGDGSAVIAVTGADTNPNIKVFGVELNDAVAECTQQNPYIEECLKADFLDGVRIKNNCFSFCFGNPPYLNDTLDGEKNRTERLFLEKVGYYLTKEAILVWVIPYSIFSEPNYFRYWNMRYETLRLYRFRKDEYKKFHQIVIIGRKRPQTQPFSQEEIAYMLTAIDSEEKIPELCRKEIESYDKIPVMPSAASDVTLFSTKEFDPNIAFATLDRNLPNEISERFDLRISVPEYVVNNIGKPPIPLKKDSLYLLATSGAGQGITGSEENNDIHLQRGVAKLIEDQQVETSANGEKCFARLTTRTQITMTIVQNNGKIDVLQ